MSQHYKIDYTGQIFGRLTVIRHFQDDKAHSRWVCKCSCGRETLTRATEFTSKNKIKGCRSCSIKDNPRKLDISLSPFRWIKHCIQIRSHQMEKETNLDLQYLKELWDSQNGICPYTGIKMILPEYKRKGRKRENMLPYQASLDRINSNLGYIKGNVEFVCLSINYGKNGFSKQQMIDFLNLIKTGT